jgi:ectoine hydroxylase-related dioxygenase (phytanoyl-CoA dioxygenase family)
VDELAAGERAQGEAGAQSSVEIRNAIARSDELLPLLDWPQTFSLMAQIMGWNIQLTTSHVFVRMPTPQAEASFKAISWHADGPNPPFPEINGVRPRMYAKIGYFLTDLSQPDRGNLRVVPGSHLRAQKPETDAATGEPVGAIQALTRPGDAVFFEQRTWHAVGPNYADYPRKNIYIGYCHRYLKAIDFITQTPELIEKANPIQRQLLGHATHELSFYLPDRAPQDVPLRAWLTENNLL